MNHLPRIIRKNWKDTCDGWILRTRSLSRCMLTAASTTPFTKECKADCTFSQIVWRPGKGQIVPGWKDWTWTWRSSRDITSSLLLLLSSVTPREQTTACSQTHSFIHAHTHKAVVPCRSRIILCSWLSPTVAAAAMAPALSPWQPGVTGSRPVCWVREPEAVRNKRWTWTPPTWSTLSWHARHTKMSDTVLSDSVWSAQYVSLYFPVRPSLVCMWHDQILQNCRVRWTNVLREACNTCGIRYVRFQPQCP